MNGQRSEKQRTPAWGRVLLVSVVALLVAGTGVVLIPRDSANPAPVPFSETARAEALGDALLLHESAAALAEAANRDAGTQALGEAVTLLTTHARALVEPDGSTPAPSGPVSSSSGERTPAAKTTRASLVSDLAASGRKRLDDARKADGGIARLLAAAGSAQLLQSGRLATAWQLPIQSPSSVASVPEATPSSAPCPSVSPTPETMSATTDAALAAMVRSEQETVYVYQVALKRLGDAAAASAAKDLLVHEQLLLQAESLTRANCGDVPTREAGYRLPAQFAQDPAASLGALEKDSLPVLGDLIALSTGETRDWAIGSLLSASQRTLDWGAALPELPGLVLDADALPPMPAPSPSTTPSAR
ncbi:DUF4439 domain-containing protein [Paenarthrobacter sp. NPDC056912]|uniref:DUF4439 domain-containing protein n=1 Tax=Paenarthrobacter sp. NPDC056912 TaxID=3345965 RepID=UPI00366DE398